MYLIQILLPVYDNRGRRLPKSMFEETSRALAKVHGGVTAYTRSPATGLWSAHGSRLKRDEVVVYEVMTPTINADLWARRRRAWQAAFRQDTIVMRAMRSRQL